MAPGKLLKALTVLALLAAVDVTLGKEGRTEVHWET